MQGTKFCIDVDKDTGTIKSLQERFGKHGTNYVGSDKNISASRFLSEPLWLGDVVLRTWTGNGWQKETTAHSKDIRDVKFNEEKKIVEVTYNGKSANAVGLKSVSLYETYHFVDDALRWDIEIVNCKDSVLEIGELAFPFTVNTNFTGLFKGKLKVEGEDWRRQKEWHERRVMQHLFIAGHSSYVLLQRPLGDPPFLFFHPVGDTALETAYLTENSAGPGGEEIYLLAAHSWATKNVRGWKRDWINGHTSLVLGPHQKKVFQFRFVLIDSYSEIREQLYMHGQLGIKVQPGMVVPIDQDLRLELKSKDKPVLLPKADGVEIGEEVYNADRYQYNLCFHTPGQKKIRVEYGENKWTNLFFYATPPIADLLKARAQFTVERQFYQNPADPYHRHHAFLPYDAELNTIFLHSDEVWEVGGSDEFGFSEPLYLAEKNVYYPNKREIETLETYIDDCLFKHIQDPKTYKVRASLYWVNRYPSSPWSHWDEKRSRQTWRTYNYPHVANIYYALYRIGKLYGLIEHRTPKEYLQMAWRTAMKCFETGEWKNVGLMGGGNAINILDDLKQENLMVEHQQLKQRMLRVVDKFVNDPYPYGSELFVDQTAHDQVYTFTKFFGRKEKMFKTLQVTQALRGGGQPLWFRYGNDKRGDMCCWYTETLNARVLLSGFEETGEHEMLMHGYGGLLSCLANLRANGVAYGWFLWRPEHMGFDPRTLDIGIGLYGFLQAVKSYVVNDETFGLIGYGCNIDTNNGGHWKITPWDGLGKRLVLAPLRIEIIVEKGELTQVDVDPKSRRISLELTDSTGFVKDVNLLVKGMNADKCYLKINGDEKVMSCDNNKLAIKGVKLVKTTKVEINPISKKT